MPQRVNKLTRQKAAGISVIDSWQVAVRRTCSFGTDRSAARRVGRARATTPSSAQARQLTELCARALHAARRSMEIIQPKAPLALRLAAVLMRGVVSLYSRQIFFLHGV